MRRIVPTRPRCMSRFIIGSPRSRGPYRRRVLSVCLQCTVVLSMHACINTQKCLVVWPSVVVIEVKEGSGRISFLATHTGALSGRQK